jgi:hypothetical protein
MFSGHQFSLLSDSTGGSSQILQGGINKIGKSILELTCILRFKSSVALLWRCVELCGKGFAVFWCLVLNNETSAY